MKAAQAYSLVRVAIRNGRLIRPSECEQCHISCNPDAHHDDYDRPLDVRWLCAECHMRLHSDQRRNNQAQPWASIEEYARLHTTDLPVRLTCSRCGHSWIRREERLPRQCSRCGSRRWNEPGPVGVSLPDPLASTGAVKKEKERSDDE